MTCIKPNKVSVYVTVRSRSGDPNNILYNYTVETTVPDQDISFIFYQVFANDKAEAILSGNYSRKPADPNYISPDVGFYVDKKSGIIDYLTTKYINYKDGWNKILFAFNISKYHDIGCWYDYSNSLFASPINVYINLCNTPSISLTMS